MSAEKSPLVRKLRSPFLVIWTLLASMAVPSAYGQDTTWKDPGYDTNYVISFRDNFVVTLVSTVSGNEIAASDKQGRTLTFGTNLPSSFGAGIDYKWLTLEYTSSFGRTGPPEKGYTRLRNLGFGLTGRKWWFRNFFQRTQGYYLKNPEFLDPQFDPAIDQYPSRTDIGNSVYFATLNYGFNHRRYSNNAAIWQLERQKKSAGSFTAGCTFSVATHTSDSALFPEQFEQQFDLSEAITRFEFYLYGLNAGYLHTFAFGKSRKFFVSLALIPGISYQKGIAQLEDSKKRYTKTGLGVHSESRLSFGYNGDRWYTSIMSVNYLVSTDFEGTNPLSQGYTFGRLAVGYKFKMKETTSPFLKRIGL